MQDARLLVEALRQPESVSTLNPAQWSALISIARAEALAGTLAQRVEGQPMPDAVAAMLADHRVSAAQAQRVALWEAEMCRRALEPLGIKTILLKGTAYAAAGLNAARGRQIGDLDILVPKARLDDAEKALLGAGWEWVKEDAYDDAYYRQWMHELPPMIHKDRDRMIDVHHTILPLTARITPDADAMIADAIEVEGGYFILSPEDRICHSVAHMFADGDMQGGLRNLWDIYCLEQDMLDAVMDGNEPPDSVWVWEEARQRIAARAALHGLSEKVARALWLAFLIYGGGSMADRRGEDTLKDTLIIRRLLARNGWGQETRKVERFGFYVRSHWLRMPPMMLARHLWTKWRKS